MNVNFGKFFICLGLFFIVLGLGVILFAKFKVPFLGKLPGDIFIRRENFTFYFPFTTAILISVILSLVFSFIFKK